MSAFDMTPAELRAAIQRVDETARSLELLGELEGDAADYYLDLLNLYRAELARRTTLRRVA